MAASRQGPVDPETALRPQHLAGKGRADGDHPIGEGDCPGQGVDSPVPLVGLGTTDQHLEPGAATHPLMSGIVNREHGRWRSRDQPQHGPGVPIVEMEDVGGVMVDERGHGGGEGEEPQVVVLPTPAVVIDVGVRPLQRRSGHQGHLRHGVDGAPPQDGRAGPVGDVEGRLRHRGRRQPAIVRQDDFHFHAESAQFPDQAGRGVPQPPDLDQRRQLGRGEQDLHPGPGWCVDRVTPWCLPSSPSL